MSKAQIGKLLAKIVVGKFQQNQQRKAQKKQDTQARAGRSNVMVNKQSNNDPIYPLYGRQRIGGTRAFVEASDGAGNVQGIDGAGEATNTTTLNLIIAMCEGEIGDIEQLWFNDTVVWDSSVNGTKTLLASKGYQLQNFMTGTKYSGAVMDITWYPGDDYQLVDQTIQSSVSAAVWPNFAQLAGISYLALKLTASEKFGGQLPTFNATLVGKKIFSLQEIQDGWTVADLANNSWVSGPNQNPADVLYDYLISDRFGKGLDRLADGSWRAGTNINIASFKQARIDCIAARNNAGYRVNGFLQTEKQIFDNVGEILETCNGMLLFVDGKYELRIQKKDEQLNLPSSSIFTKDEIVGEIGLTLPTKTTRLNKVTGLFNNAAEKWNDDLVIFQSDPFTLEDNGSVLEAQEDYTMITDANIVTDLITQMANISRDQYQVALTVAHVGLLLKSGDIIEIRHDDFGWGIAAGQTQKFWRVQELVLTEDNTVEITATTYNSALEL
tara:strand:+ start:10127 stop:11617 length:1491 start_codon:yes stop_codon:yes gene_type:complete